MKRDTARYLTDLTDFARACDVYYLASEVLNDPSFLTCSGCHDVQGHHYGEGGLLQHTWEVVTLAMNAVDFYTPLHPNLDRKEVYISALYHDYGKTWDYDHDPESNTWVANNHRRTIHHIQRSAFEWQRVARFYTLDCVFTDRVTHNILAHHGSRAAGSPVPPYTREAYILHTCDHMSARVDDCDRIDVTKINRNA